MRPNQFVYAALMLAALLGWQPEARAQSATDDTVALQQEIDHLKQDFETLKQEYGSRLAMLEAKMAAIQKARPALEPLVLTANAGPAQEQPQQPQQPPQPQQPVPTQQPTEQAPPGAGGAGGPTGPLPVYGGATSGSKVFNPDI